MIGTGGSYKWFLRFCNQGGVGTRALSDNTDSKQTNRGNKAHVIECDEFGFIKGDLFYRAVVPLYQMDEAALIAITTPSTDPTSQYSELLNMVDDNSGKSVYRHYEYSFVCPKYVSALVYRKLRSR